MIASYAGAKPVILHIRGGGVSSVPYQISYIDLINNKPPFIEARNDIIAIAFIIDAEYKEKTIEFLQQHGSSAVRTY